MAFATLEANLIGVEAESRGVGFRWPKCIPCEAVAVEELVDGRLADAVMAFQGKVDLVSGGPPCQGFSFSGRRQATDPRNRLVDAYIAFVLRLRPKLILVENVPGILVPHGAKLRRLENPRGLGRPPRSYAERLSEALDGAYLFSRDTVDAAEFGVPQARKRFFGIGILRSLIATPPERNVGASQRPGLFDGQNLDPFWHLREIRAEFLRAKGLDARQPVSVAEAIGDFCSGMAEARPCTDPDSPSGFKELGYRPPPPKAQSAFVKLMRHGMNGQVPDSLRLARHRPEVEARFERILANCPRGVRLNDAHRLRYSTLKNRIVPLHPDQPGHTVTTLPDDILHYEQPRILTVRENARLQSFPDWFKFKGKFTTGGNRRKRECPRYTQVGNAVPPLLAEAWGYALSNVLAALADGERTAREAAALAACR